MSKHYAERDIMELDEIGNHYINHVSAMTSEKLHGKSDIAAELGYRDMLIEKLTAELDSALAQNAELVARNPEQLNNCLAALQIANKRIDTLEKYNLDLANESHNKRNMIDYERGKNADLVAMVEDVRSALFEPSIDSAIIYRIKTILNKTPTQHLRDRDAEVGRAGFVAGYHKMHIEFVGPIAPAGSAEHADDHYAEKVRSGEV